MPSSCLGLMALSFSAKENETQEPMTYQEITTALHQQKGIDKAKKTIQRYCQQLDDYNKVVILKEGGKQGAHVVKLCENIDERQETFDDFKDEICNQTQKAFEKKWPECIFNINENVINPISGKSETVFVSTNSTSKVDVTSGTLEGNNQCPTKFNIIPNDEEIANPFSILKSNEKVESGRHDGGDTLTYIITKEKRVSDIFNPDAKQNSMSQSSKSPQNNVLNNCLGGKQDTKNDRDIDRDTLMSHVSHLTHPNIKVDNTPEKKTKGDSKEPMQNNRIIKLLDLIRKLIEPDGFAPLDKVKYEAAQNGYAQSELDADIVRLKGEGRIFIEPLKNRIGVV